MEIVDFFKFGTCLKQVNSNWTEFAFTTTQAGVDQCDGNNFTANKRVDFGNDVRGTLTIGMASMTCTQTIWATEPDNYLFNEIM